MPRRWFEPNLSIFFIPQSLPPEESDKITRLMPCQNLQGSGTYLPKQLLGRLAPSPIRSFTLSWPLRPFLENDSGCFSSLTSCWVNSLQEENIATTKAATTSRRGSGGRHARGRHRGWRKMSPEQKSRGTIGQGSERDEKEAKGILRPCQVDMSRTGWGNGRGDWAGAETRGASQEVQEPEPGVSTG